MAVRTFDCGEKPLNDFLCTAEVEDYEEEQLGITTVVYYKGTLVAYYTLSTSSLRTEYLDSKKTKSLSRLGEFRLQEIPSITIGRLAVQKEWQSKGIGRTIMFHIVNQALSTLGVAGVRLLLVQAKIDAFDFYEKMGFQFVELTRKERQRIKIGSRTMFFDLTQLNGVRKV